MTAIGDAVNQSMEQAFPVIIDVNFTANMESLLDKIGEGTVDWKVVVRNFYPDLDEAVKKAEAELDIDEDKAKEMSKKMKKAQFDFERMRCPRKCVTCADETWSSSMVLTANSWRVLDSLSADLQSRSTRR